MNQQLHHGFEEQKTNVTFITLKHFSTFVNVTLTVANWNRILTNVKEMVM